MIRITCYSNDPKLTRVVGFRTKAFLPKKKGKRK